MTVAISTHTYSNKSTRFNDLDLYIPEGTNTSTPLIVFVHGGAWRSEDKADHTTLANALAAKGYPVAVPNYRLSLIEIEGQPPSVQHPKHVEDMLEAVLYLAHTFQSNAYDASAIYLVGHSAGGHIVSSLLLDTNYAAKLQPIVRGVISAAGIHDIPLIIKMFPGYLDFIAQAFGQDRTRYADASPATMTPQDNKSPPFLVINSLEDKLIDVSQGLGLVNHLQSIGINVKFDISVKGDHYEMVHGPDFVDAIVDFIKPIELNTYHKLAK